MEYRRANDKDIDLFVKNRIEFVTSIRDISDVWAFENRTRQYIEEHIEKDDLIIFIAIEGNKIVSSCMTCIFQTAPVPGCIAGRTAELLNVYTVEEYRRQGCAETLIGMLIRELKKQGVGKILLDYTDMGFPLYKKLGFTPLENQMQMKL